MARDTESFNDELYNLLKVRGYTPVPLNSQNQRVRVSQEADVIEFTFKKDGADYGKVWVSLDDSSKVIVYFDDEQADSPDNITPGVEYDDTWEGFLKHLKNWAQRRQLDFELSNKDQLGDRMRQREHLKMKERVAEGLKDTLKKGAKSLKRGLAGWEKGLNDVDTIKTSTKTLSPSTQEFVKNRKVTKGSPAELQQNLVNREKNNQVVEGYHSMGRARSYNDAVPNVKIVLQHNRNIEEGEQRYRNVAKIYLENIHGERFLAPTTKPGVAQVYARHIAEGGVPNDDRWNHIKKLCEEYNKMAGFVRATRNGEFTESTQKLVLEGINHYNKLRESLGKMRGHRGYNAYFESWSPPLMEDENDDTINELFVQETMDPRIESVMPILSRLRKNIAEMNEVNMLENWADNVISEKLELGEEKEGWMNQDDAENSNVPAFVRRQNYYDAMKAATGGPALRRVKNEPHKDEVEESNLALLFTKESDSSIISQLRKIADEGTTGSIELEDGTNKFSKSMAEKILKLYDKTPDYDKEKITKLLKTTNGVKKIIDFVSDKTDDDDTSTDDTPIGRAKHTTKKKIKTSRLAKLLGVDES